MIDLDYIGSCILRNSYANKNVVWYSCIEERPVYLDEMMDLFGYSNEQAILESGQYLPFTIIDMPTLIREFLEIKINKNVKRALRDIPDHELEEAFQNYIWRSNQYDLRCDWRDFENEKAEVAAREWAKENRVRYKEWT